MGYLRHNIDTHKYIYIHIWGFPKLRVPFPNNKGCSLLVEFGVLGIER